MKISWIQRNWPSDFRESSLSPPRRWVQFFTLTPNTFIDPKHIYCLTSFASARTPLEPPSQEKLRPGQWPGLPAAAPHCPVESREALMSKVLMSWEMGGGLGHLPLLLPLARRLQADGHRVLLALPGSTACPPGFERPVAPRRPSNNIPLCYGSCNRWQRRVCRHWYTPRDSTKNGQCNSVHRQSGL